MRLRSCFKEFAPNWISLCSSVISKDNVAVYIIQDYSRCLWLLWIVQNWSTSDIHFLFSSLVSCFSRSVCQVALSYWLISVFIAYQTKKIYGPNVLTNGGYCSNFVKNASVIWLQICTHNILRACAFWKYHVLNLKGHCMECFCYNVNWNVIQ